MFKLNKLRNELDFNKDIAEIINVLKGVASSEFYRLQKEKKSLDEFLSYLQGFFGMVDTTGLQHTSLDESSLPQALLLITSDIGFLGKLNVSIVNAAREQASADDEFIVLGKQGVRYIEETGRKYTSFAGVTDEVEYEEAESLGSYILKGLMDKKFHRTTIVYPHFISFAVWKVQTYQLFPCRFLFKESAQSGQEGKKHNIDQGGIIIEPALTNVVDHLIRIWINYVIYGIFWESKLAEWATRVMHLEGSSDEIKQMNKKLRSQYFRLVHEVSDNNLREIVAAMLAMKQSSAA
ncbi:MAG: FoF1 ATP synthase subunit gamma [Candidatus Orphnella occulta]|nr:FoF1 ATP synthase subunit gamma [Candidatus Orphnella occulta]